MMTALSHEGGAGLFGGHGLLTYLAVVALPTVAADTLVHTDFVDAGASIAARVALAVVDVCFFWKDKKIVSVFAEANLICHGQLCLVLCIVWSLVLLSWQ